MSARKDLTRFLKDVQSVFNDAKRKRTMRPMAREAILIIVKRTRAGFGVEKDGGRKRRLARLSRDYIERRRRMAAILSPFTSPGKSNLTFSGEYLFSIGVKKSPPGTIAIGPIGRRSDGLSNAFIGQLHEEGTDKMPARPHLHLAKSEIKQLSLFYRKTFINLLRRRKLT